MARSNGIMGIDFGYAVALLGTMISGCVFSVGDRLTMLSHEHYYALFDFFPALFFFLNGVKLSLTMRDRRVSMRKLLSYVAKRGGILLTIGFVFIGIWPLNLFVPCGLFFLVAPVFAQWNNVIIRILAVASALIAIMIINTDVETFPLYSGFQLQGSGMRELVAFLLFNGYYSFLPWFVFFLVGFDYGRTDIRPKGLFPPSSFVAIALIAVGIFIEMQCHKLYNPIDELNSLRIFPFSLKLFIPSFIVMMAGICILFVNTSVFLLRRYSGKLVKPITSISGSKYSIYAVQLLFAFITIRTFNLIMFHDKYFLLVYIVGDLLLCIWLIALWRKKVDEVAPIERLIKRVSGSAKKS
jgi:hypothetical protein